MLRASADPMIAADFQSILAALVLLQRGEDGRYPPRNPLQDPWLLPLTEAISARRQSPTPRKLTLPWWPHHRTAHRRGGNTSWSASDRAQPNAS